MKPRNRFLALYLSVLAHSLIAILLWRSRAAAPIPSERISPRILVEVSDVAGQQLFESSRKRSKGKASRARLGALDLRPAYMKEGWLLGAKTGEVGVSGGEKSESETLSSELLNVNPKVTAAFDNLAGQINHFLDYPSILIENGVQGTATLDLYFDSRGEIDENRSKFLGGHRSLRGLLVRASRQGLEKWYRADGARLDKDQFKNQHFHADFSISYTLTEASKVEKEGEGSYRLVRRHYSSVCANPMGLDLACIAVKGYGAVRRALTDDYRVKLAALQDVLDHYDDIRLQGMREIIRGI